VPYWWDKKPESLAATVYNQRPDLFTEKPTSPSIPVNPPIVRQLKTESKQEIFPTFLRI
jgi:hypothetical protein